MNKIFSRTAIRAVVPAWLAARLVVGFTMVLVNIFAPEERAEFVRQRFQSWDAGWYRSLLVDGYDLGVAEGFRFFPGYVLLGRAVHVFLPGDAQWSLLLVSNGASLLMLFLLYQLVIGENMGHRLAGRTIWLMAFFPTGFVLVWGYAESLFLVFVIAGLLALRKRNWWGTAALFFAAGLTRPTGVLVVFAVAISLFKAGRRGPWLAKIAALLGAPLGVSAYLWWAYSSTGEPWLPLTVQRTLRGGFVDPFSRLGQGFGDLWDKDPDAFHLVTALIFLALLAVVVKKMPMVYGAYAGSVLLVALAAENINSLERYAMSAFPLVIALAFLMENRRLQRVIPAASLAGLVCLTAAASLGIYVP